jgi:ATP-dependent DNA ligase
MEARSVDVLPVGDQWQYEPKWDGFRCLLARDGDVITMLSKSGRDLKRYFPEIEKAALALPETRFLLDGELVIQMADRFSFDDLLQRIHPAKGRIDKLAKASPALFLAFDLLGWGKKMSALEPMAMRRPQLLLPPIAGNVRC